MDELGSTKNLLARIRGTYRTCTSLDHDNEPTLESQDEHATLTARRRKFAMSRPVHNKTTSAKFKSARNKLRGLLLWRKMRTEIQVFGTSSNLFDAFNSYKRNLNCVMLRKRREKKAVGEKAEWPRGLINPECRFKQVWNFVVILLLLYTFILTPYLIAFEEVVIWSNWFFVDLSVDTCFFLDIAINLNSAFIDKQGVYVTSRKLIFIRYLKGMLLVDFLSVFPFYLFGSGTNTRSNVFVRFLRMARLTRIFRASKVVGIMKHFSNSKAMENIVDFLKTYSGITRLITALVIVLLVLHFTACMWYYSARLDDFSPDTWVVRSRLQDETKSMQYISALYWSISTLMTVGYGDITAYTTVEKVICMLWMMVGVGFYSFTIGTLSSVLSSIDAKSSMLNTKLLYIKLFAKDTKLPDSLVKKINKYIKGLSDNVIIDEKQRKALLIQLPKSIRLEVAMSMQGRAACKVDFLKEQDVAFLANVVPLLQQQKFADNEFVYQIGDLPEEVYFIVSGRVNYVYKHLNTIFKTEVKGSYFGEVELLGQVPREFSTLTEGNCEFLVMNKATFKQVMKEYPKVAQQITETAANHKALSLLAQNELVQMLQKVEVKNELAFKDLVGMKKNLKIPRKIRRTKSMLEFASSDRIPKRLQDRQNPPSMDIRALRNELEGLKSLAATIYSSSQS